jgi:hypothetical protein
MCREQTSSLAQCDEMKNIRTSNQFLKSQHANIVKKYEVCHLRNRHRTFTKLSPKLCSHTWLQSKMLFHLEEHRRN